MRRRAIFAECQTQLWLDVATALGRELDCEPVYWVARRSFEPQVRQRFPQAVFHDRTSAIRGLPAPALRDLPLRPIDAAILSRYSYQQLTAGRIMDRFDAGNAFGYEEKVALFHQHLRYWRTVLEHLKPDYAIFPVQPHMLYDYTIYELCQEYSIKPCMFQWTLFHDTLYPINHIDRGYTDIELEYLRRLQSADRACTLSPRAEGYLAQVARSYRDAMPRNLVKRLPAEYRAGVFQAYEMPAPALEAGDYGLISIAESPDALTMPAGAPPIDPEEQGAKPDRTKPVPLAKRLKALRRQGKILRKRTHHLGRQAGEIWRRLSVQNMVRQYGAARKATRLRYKLWVKPVLTAFVQGDLNRPLKERNRPMARSFADRLGGLRLQRYRLEGLLSKRRLHDRYRALSQAVRPDVPYVFVALHYQPEQTTCPTGGVFVDQWLMVDLLSKCVPAGWMIYVKEHPYQFYSNGIGERGRTPDFYDDLVALPNVRLVPWTTSPFELIDNARAVATVTGTTGTEALLRGKPVLVFGYAWYRACDGAFYTPTALACKGALDAVAAGYRPDSEKVRLFFHVVEQQSIVADIGIGERHGTLPHDENVARVAAAIARRLAPDSYEIAAMPSPVPVSERPRTDASRSVAARP